MFLQSLYPLSLNQDWTVTCYEYFTVQVRQFVMDLSKLPSRKFSSKNRNKDFFNCEINSMKQSANTNSN